jgi:hypothetical protein
MLSARSACYDYGLHIFDWGGKWIHGQYNITYYFKMMLWHTDTYAVGWLLR